MDVQDVPGLRRVCRHGADDSADDGAVDPAVRQGAQTGEIDSARCRTEDPQPPRQLLFHVRSHEGQQRRRGPGQGGAHVEAPDERVAGGTRSAYAAQANRPRRSPQGN